MGRRVRGIGSNLYSNRNTAGGSLKQALPSTIGMNMFSRRIYYRKRICCNHLYSK